MNKKLSYKWERFLRGDSHHAASYGEVKPHHLLASRHHVKPLSFVHYGASSLLFHYHGPNGLHFSAQNKFFDISGVTSDGPGALSGHLIIFIIIITLSTVTFFRRFLHYPHIRWSQSFSSLIILSMHSFPAFFLLWFCSVKCNFSSLTLSYHLPLRAFPIFLINLSLLVYNHV